MSQELRLRSHPVGTIYFENDLPPRRENEEEKKRENDEEKEKPTFHYKPQRVHLRQYIHQDRKSLS